MFPLNDAGMVSGLVCGFLFGFVLENAGFGSPCKLTAQFSLRDWSVFKVMFTAIVVTAAGLWLLQLAGVLKADAAHSGDFPSIASEKYYCRRTIQIETPQ